MFFSGDSDVVIAVLSLISTPTAMWNGIFGCTLGAQWPPSTKGSRGLYLGSVKYLPDP